MYKLKFEMLKGLTLTAIEGKVGDDTITFTTIDGRCFKLYHDRDCCEYVSVEDICGDLDDILNSPILLAEEVTSNENPKGVTKPQFQHTSFTWTFYKIATMKGSVTIRFYGESNGYYSESVDFIEV